MNHGQLLHAATCKACEVSNLIQTTKKIITLIFWGSFSVFYFLLNHSLYHRVFHNRCLNMNYGCFAMDSLYLNLQPPLLILPMSSTKLIWGSTCNWETKRKGGGAVGGGPKRGGKRRYNRK